MPRSALTVLGTAILLSATPCGGAGQTAPEPRPPKSAATAITLSALGTVAPIALGAATVLPSNDYDGGYNALLVLYGIYLGPATGYFYAGEPGRGARGAGVRAGITLGTVLMAGAVCSSGGCDIMGSDDNSMAAAVMVVFFGTVGVAASMVHDIVSAGGAARRWNAKQPGGNISVVPTLNPVTGAPGMAVRVGF